MERRVSKFEDHANLSTSQLLSVFEDCPFLGCSQYHPIKDESKSMVVRTYFAIHKVTREEVVIKLVERGVSDMVARELLAHFMCHGHPYIAELREVFLTPGYLAIVMKYVPGFSLEKRIDSEGPVSEDVARRIFQQLLLATKFLHDSGYTNRDIKINNIIFDDQTGGIVLQDFMYSRHDQINSDPREAFKSLPYMPPELLSGADRDKFGDTADVWELGVCLYKMVTGKFPFEKPGDGPVTYKSVPLVISRISKMDYQAPENVSDSLRDLLQRIFVSNTSDRIDLEGIFGHEWLNSGPWPCSAQDIQKKMTESSCPIDIAFIESILQQARMRGTAAPPLSSSDTVDRVCDTITDQVLMEEGTQRRVEELNLHRK